MRGDEAFVLEDPLARLPDAPNDLYTMRTWPGQPERGVVRFHPLDEDTWAFHAILPRRYGDLGAIPRHGLFANGGWYPQPVGEDGLPIATWRVRVALPEGTLGALGDTWGEDVLTWEGVGERASLAVVPRGIATPLPSTPRVTLLTRGTPRRRLVRELDTQLEAVAVAGVPWRGVVVEAPLRRRLARGGRGMAYVSDRAFKVTNGFERFHRVGVTRGVMEGLIPRGDPYVRSLVAAGLSHQHSATRVGPDARRLLRWAAWIPTVYGVMHSRRMPFYAEILEDAHPGDPIRDDLVEVFAPHTPGTAVAMQIVDRYGPLAGWTLAEGLMLGLPLDRAAAISGVDAAWLDAWRAPYPDQDYTLRVQRDPPLVTVQRDAPADAPPEAIVLSIDGERSVHLTGAGSDAVFVLPPRPPRRVALDPDRHLDQRSRAGDQWPPRLHVNLTGSITAINFTELYVYGWAGMFVRKAGNTRDVWAGYLITNDTTLAGASLRYTRLAGAPLDGLARRHRLTWSFNPSLLNPRYADTERGRFVLGAGMTYTYSDREATYFPLSGNSLTASINGGVQPGSDRRWGTGSLGWTGVASPHPRHAFALHAQAAVHEGTIAHRRLSLGGEGALRSIGTSELLGTRRALALAEYRIAPLRNASVPLWLLWGTELQLALGVEAGALWVDGQPKQAIGATVGITTLGQVLGFEERAIGVSVALPLHTWGFVSERAGKPQVYLRWGQAF